jgi:hypothetical protein
MIREFRMSTEEIESSGELLQATLWEIDDEKA